MDICVLGCGMQGRVAAVELSKNHNVTVLDINCSNLKQLKKIPRIKTLEFDVTEGKKLCRFLKNFDIVLGALPSSLGFYSLECALKAKKDIVDMSYLPEDPFILDRFAKRLKIRIVVDAGFAPGLSNILVGETYREWGRIDTLKIVVGGIPQKPLPPFYYRITWSPADLIEEYLRPARILKNYKLTVVPALTGIEEFTLRGVGRLECFYTDGLRTLLKTIKGARNMEEKTIRYPGHAELFKRFIDCKFFSDEVVELRGKKIRVKEFALEFLRNLLSRGDEKDISILIIEMGLGRRKKKYLIVDRYDTRRNITSMARMTAYTGATITEVIKKYPRYGIIPPEYLGFEKKLCNEIKSTLRKRGIKIP
ncbi:MAG: saccharopine dehydrogenase C-terminal domain-containing protein [candidate division WOR-3 bacterium]